MSIDLQKEAVSLRQSTTLADVVRVQAEAVIAGGAGSVEYVAAKVARWRGFTNHGHAASGHDVVVDEPTQFGGAGSAADPAELALIAIGASLSVTLTAHAALAGIEVRNIRIALYGKLDAVRFFAPVDAPGGGFYDLNLAINLESDHADGAARALVDRALLACPVLRSFEAKPTVTVTIETALGPIIAAAHR